MAITRTGLSARLVSKYRPRSRLIAVTDSEDASKALAVCWGVHILKIAAIEDALLTMFEAERMALENRIALAGDLLVFIVGTGQPQAGPNLLEVRRAASED
jgi:pyruvate kinase